MNRTKNKTLKKSISLYVVGVYSIFACFVILVPIVVDTFYVRNEKEALITFLEKRPELIELSEYLNREGYSVTLPEKQEETTLVDYVVTNRDQRVINLGVKQTMNDTRILLTNGDELVVTMNQKLLDEYTMTVAKYSLKIDILALIGLGLTILLIQNKIGKSFGLLEDNIQRMKESKNKDSYNALDASEYKEFQDIIEHTAEMIEEIKQYEKKHKALVATLNHEIKSPLNTINSLIEANKMQIDKYKDLNLYAEFIQKEIQQTAQTVQLALESFEYKFKLEKINVKEKISEILEEKKSKFEINKLEIEIEQIEPLIIEYDKVLFELMISNVLENVARYAKQKTVVSIKITKTYFLIENMISEDAPDSTSGWGLRLIEFLMEGSGWKIDVLVEKNKYITLIEKIEN